MKTIIINENCLPILKESQEEVTFYKFFTEAKAFIKGLMNDPLHAKPNGFFKNHGISRSILINRMLDRSILTKKETINEPYDADGKLQSIHTLEYRVPKKNFERKMRRLYSYFFEPQKNENKLTDEMLKEDEGGAMGGGSFAGASNANISAYASYDVPLGAEGDKKGNVLRRSFWTVGNSEDTMQKADDEGSDIINKRSKKKSK